MMTVPDNGNLVTIQRVQKLGGDRCEQSNEETTPLSPDGSSTDLFTLTPVPLHPFSCLILVLR